jgi:periplasmic divalent cation tolerance protein
VDPAPATDIVLLLTTVPVDLDVDALVRPLLERRLAACVSILAPMRSVYRWQGGIEVSEERQLIIKTTRGRLAMVQAELTAGHPYEVPESLVVPVTGGGEAYLRWLRAETTPGSSNA